MVRIEEDGRIHIKVLYWGMAGSGKTTIVDTLHRLTKEQKLDMTPKGELKKIDMANGSTLYFDRGIFQSTKTPKIFYHIYTVAGQTQFSPLRKTVFEGTDGVLFVVDSQTFLFEDNIESLKELKKVAQGDLIKEIPMVVMLNKKDLDETIGAGEFEHILKEEGLWYSPPNKLSLWNPIIFETCALYNLKRDIYRSFYECARRTALYHIYGNGTAPIDDEFLKKYDKK